VLSSPGVILLANVARLVGISALTLALTACSIGGTGSGGGTPASSGTASSPPGSSAAGQSSVPTTRAERLAENAIRTAEPSIVRIQTNSGLGSGVIFTSSGYIVTNYHVVSGSRTVQVTLASGKKLSARVIATDSVDDVAVIKVGATGLPAATFGDSGRLQVGQTVLALGNPLGISHTATEGIVSDLNRTVKESQTDAVVRHAIQTSAPINPGNSGGGLINLAGQVIGIPSLTAIDPEFNAPANGIGFAIPSNLVSYLAEQVVKRGKIVHTGRAAIGAYIESVDPTIAAQFNLPVDHGVLIARLVPGGAADKAGLRKGDVIVQFNGHLVDNESQLVDDLLAHKPGDHVSMTVKTPDGNSKRYRLTLSELPANANG